MGRASCQVRRLWWWYGRRRHGAARGEPERRPYETPSKRVGKRKSQRRTNGWQRKREGQVEAPRTYRRDAHRVDRDGGGGGEDAPQDGRHDGRRRDPRADHLPRLERPAGTVLGALHRSRLWGRRGAVTGGGHPVRGGGGEQRGGQRGWNARVRLGRVPCIQGRRSQGICQPSRTSADAQGGGGRGVALRCCLVAMGRWRSP